MTYRTGTFWIVSIREFGGDIDCPRFTDMRNHIRDTHRPINLFGGGDIELERIKQQRRDSHRVICMKVSNEKIFQFIGCQRLYKFITIDQRGTGDRPPYALSRIHQIRLPINYNRIAGTGPIGVGEWHTRAQHHQFCRRSFRIPILGIARKISWPGIRQR